MVKERAVFDRKWMREREDRLDRALRREHLIRLGILVAMCVFLGGFILVGILWPQ